MAQTASPFRDENLATRDAPAFVGAGAGSRKKRWSDDGSEPRTHGGDWSKGRTWKARLSEGIERCGVT